MNKRRLVTIAAWGNIIGFFAMRFMRKAYDYTPSFKRSDIDDFFGLVIFFLIMAAPGAYYYAQDIKSSEENVKFGHLIDKIWETGVVAFLLGIVGIIIGRTL